MLLEQFLGCSGKHNVAALATCQRPDIDEVVGLQHHLLVVLNHQDGVAVVAQGLQRVNQALVVALVQTDGRLVKDIKHVNQARPNLGSEPDALTLAARERRRVAVQRHVVQAHLKQEVEPRADFLDDFARDFPLRGRDVIVQVLDPVAQLADVHRRQLGDVLAVEPEVERLAVESGAATLGTHNPREELPRPLLGGAGGGIILLHLDVLDQAIKGEEIVAGGECLGAQVQALVGAVEDVVQRFLGQLTQGSVERAVIFLTNRGQLPKDLDIPVFAQRQDAAATNAQRHVGHDFLTVDEVDIAQSLAMWTGAQR